MNFGRRGIASNSNGFARESEITIFKIAASEFRVAVDPVPFRFRGEAIEHGLLLAQSTQSKLLFCDGSDVTALWEPQS